MKNYVVGILSFFDNELKLFKITAENEYEAVKKGFVELASTPESKQNEIDWQNSPHYPSDLEEMLDTYEDISFNVIEI